MIIEWTHKDSLNHVLNALENQKIFIYPTDTIYGFGGDARSDEVIERIYNLKARPDHMPVSMLVRDIDMLNEYAFITNRTKKLIDHFLPGALTLVLQAKDATLPEKLFSVQGYLGFRIPDHDFCKKLTKKFNAPIITTSVNLSGQSALNKISDIEKQFGHKVDVLISDPELEKKFHAKGSTVIMITKDDELKVLREGAIPRSNIFQLL